jgi:hypothetical protein
MITTYSVEIINMERKEELVERYGGNILYEIKSDVYGCCIKLLTSQESVKSRWEENFYYASQNIRSHGRLYVSEDPSLEENKVYYDPYSRTAILFNFNYYGWIKSIALSVAGDILEDEHGIYSVHGACLDARGRGLCMLGGSGAGKTTHTYGLLTNPQVRVVSDDWFFARVYGDSILAYGSEKNFYIRADLSDIWKEYAWLVEKALFDKQGRAVVDIRWIIGKGRILPITTLEKMIILKRDFEDSQIIKELEPLEALKILDENSFFNPHLLVRNNFKKELRREFFYTLLTRTKVFQVNTTGTPEETQKIVKDIVSN